MKNVIAMRFKTPEAANHYANQLRRRNPHWEIEVHGRQVEVKLQAGMQVQTTAREMVS